MDIELFSFEIKKKGWIVIEEVLPLPLVNQLNTDLEKTYHICREWQIKNGLEVGTDGSVHHILNLAPSFLSLLDNLPLDAHLTTYFEGPYILNSYGGFINTRHSNAYVGKVHRDIRTFSAHLPLMLNMLIMLDEFSLENGATHLLSGSHLQSEKPSDETFFRHAERATGKKGSILLFNSNLWHAAGQNFTDNSRRALTLTFSKPFMKQQFDYPRALGYDTQHKLSEKLQQVIGYNARVPENHDEWYQPLSNRLYQSGQG